MARRRTRGSIPAQRIEAASPGDPWLPDPVLLPPGIEAPGALIDFGETVACLSAAARSNLGSLVNFKVPVARPPGYRRHSGTTVAAVGQLSLEVRARRPDEPVVIDCFVDAERVCVIHEARFVRGHLETGSDGPGWGMEIVQTDDTFFFGSAAV